MEFIFNTTPQRSDLMKKIKCKNTKSEDLFAKELWKRGIRYRRNFSKLPGNPDIAITRYKVAIFIDGEFWHGFNWDEKKKRIKVNRDYWIPKIERTLARDKKNNIILKEQGWEVIRFWEKQVKNEFNNCIEFVIDILRKRDIGGKYE